MRRTLTFLAIGLTLWPAAAAIAKFGITKTKLLLPRLRPPDSPPIAENVFVDVRSGSPEVTGAHVALVRDRLEDALRDVYRLADRARDAEAVIRVTMDALRAEVRDEVRMERQRVKVGEREVWDEKKKKYKTEDVYKDQDVPVPWRIAEGSVEARVEVRGESDARPVDAGASYHQSFKKQDRIPNEATTEENLKRFLVAGVAGRAVAAVAFSPDPVEALLAVNGELKPGNKLAEAGLFKEALEEWSRRTYKGDTEAARLHNVGVAHEGLAYRLPPREAEHRTHLEQAQDLYRKAKTLDPDEKYFNDPLERIETSLGYATSAARLAADLKHMKEDASERRRAEAAPAPPTGRKPAPAPRPAASASIPLRNGSFESSLAPWTLTGKGSVVEETRRGRVLEVLPGTAEAAVRQAVAVDMPEGRNADLSLEYKVTSGEGQVRILLAYADGAGHDRVSTLPVTSGEGPGAWAPWSTDLAALRPRPARVKEVRIVVEGGTVRLDNVALTVR